MAAPKPSIIALGLSLGLLIASCGGSDTASDGTQSDTLAVDTTPKETELINVGGQLFSIPSPVQTALAIRKAGLKYQKDLTAPLDKGDVVVGKVGQSLVLGMYGADMAYVTVHKDGQRAMATMQAIEKVGNKLELTNSFDRALLEKFKANLGSEDSLLQFSGTAFRAADQYLKNNQRDDVSALVLAGGWLESLYLTISDPAAAKDQTLVNRIGEQKNTLAALVELLERSDKEKAATTFIAGLKELNALFAGITSTYTFQEPVTDAAKKTTFINSTSTITIPADQLGAISAKVTALRNMILA
ncbi:MAG TPA: hypothetical protein PLB89_16410 [Flavobacteriales bacterium]|nr:hypothetical protein [Flavobacteriales bacterium]